jgi:hypothetical protein
MGSSVSGIYGLIVLIVIGHSVFRSKKRMMTFIITVVAMTSWAGLLFLVSLCVSTNIGGALGSSLVLTTGIVGMLTARQHSHKNRSE